MKPLLTEDLLIRPFERSDVDAFVAAVRESVSTVGLWMPWCHEHYSDSHAQAWIQACAENLGAGFSYDLGIFSTDDKELFGGISINQLNRAHNFGNIGYWVRQSRQRQGIATRAVQAIARFGFDDLKLARLEIVAAENNDISRRVAEKAGAVFECVARNRLIVHGQAQPAAVYSLVPGKQEGSA
jgi:RimJ/RimL family protein N-acetyltransferase